MIVKYKKRLTEMQTGRGVFAASEETCGERDRDNLLRAKRLAARENKITLLQEDEKRIE